MLAGIPPKMSILSYIGEFVDALRWCRVSRGLPSESSPGLEAVAVLRGKAGYLEL